MKPKLMTGSAELTNNFIVPTGLEMVAAVVVILLDVVELDNTDNGALLAEDVKPQPNADVATTELDTDDTADNSFVGCDSKALVEAGLKLNDPAVVKDDVTRAVGFVTEAVKLNAEEVDEVATLVDVGVKLKDGTAVVDNGFPVRPVKP